MNMQDKVDAARTRHGKRVGASERILRAEIELLVKPGMRVRIEYDPHHFEGMDFPENPPSVEGTEGVTASGIRLESDYTGDYFYNVDVKDNVGVREYDYEFLEFLDD